MPIKKYLADADNTIVNAFQSNLQTRGTGANAGMADVLETFSVYGRVASGSQELSRILVKFPTTSISTDRTAGNIPASGSVNFYLRVFNAETSKTVPRDIDIVVHAVSQSWQEGVGLDLENYKDLTDGNAGSNWMSASNTAFWTDINGTLLAGGSYHTQSVSNADVNTEVHIFKQTLESGLEDLEINITPLVEQWMAGTYSNYGVGIALSASQEAYVSGALNTVVKRTPRLPDPADSKQSVIYNPSGSTKSYYTKRFFARGSQFFYKRPVIEARWNNVTRDDRGSFYYSSSLAPAADNLNTLYLYNYVRGRLTNIPSIGSTGSIMVSLFSGSADNSEPSGSRLSLYDGTNSITGGFVSTGIYSCSIAVTSSDTPIKTLYDVWHSGSANNEHASSLEYFTGSIRPKSLEGSSAVNTKRYFINITNLRNEYAKNENARFNLYIRNKNWSPTIYTKAKENPPHHPIVSASYRVFRVLDALEVIPYNTGSDFATGLSYDVSGNYFNVDMELLDPGYEYGFKFAFYDEELNSWTEQNNIFKFRVLDDEY
ncbi:MAG: hypothetical protein CML45_00595 [Rhodobacteraceae bacterium]|mgnify:CR=1 FL=1|nr:hypothetical protein [Paracoccaceae bacterium]|tara:strand:+ start:2639 stop:4270 length:1632 start_codon:yes stop_codon:yes gene_type:complete